MDESEIKLIKQYLLDNIPIKLDLRRKDLVYDKRCIYYKIYKYIMELEERK